MNYIPFLFVLAMSLGSFGSWYASRFTPVKS